MKIIVGHSNMDLDCIASMVLARKLFPDHVPVRSRRIHPVAEPLYRLYSDDFGFVPLGDVKGQELDELVVVDTRSYGRVKEFLEAFPGFSGRVRIFDHHPADSNDFPGAEIHECEYGANATLLGRLVMEQGIELDAAEATVALTGIFADTGNFTHENVTPEDFAVASFLLSRGANLKLVRQFLKTITARHQLTVFHDVINRLAYRTVHGHFFLFARLFLEEQTGGLAAVVEKVFDVEGGDALFCFFTFEKSGQTLIIARSADDGVEVNYLLRDFGGGGHRKAASALLKNADPERVYTELLGHLESQVVRALRAADLMTTDVKTVDVHLPADDADRYFDEIGHGAAPVTEGTRVVGLVTRRQLRKAQDAGQGHAPVKACMLTSYESVTPETSLHRIEELLFKDNIGHLPVMDGEDLKGIVTRADYLAAMG